MTQALTLNEGVNSETGLPMSRTCDCSKCSKENCGRRTGPTENAFHNVDESRFAAFGLPAEYLKSDGSFKQPNRVPDTPSRTILGVDETRLVTFGLPSDPGYKKFLETT